MYTATYWAPNRCEHNTIYLWYPGTSQWRIQGRVLGDLVPPSPLFLAQTEKFFRETTNPPPPPSTLNVEPKPNLSKILKGLLMLLVIFENTIFQLNSLIITESVCYISGSKVNRKERSRPSLLVCFFVPPC